MVVFAFLPFFSMFGSNSVVPPLFDMVVSESPLLFATLPSMAAAMPAATPTPMRDHETTRRAVLGPSAGAVSAGVAGVSGVVDGGGMFGAGLGGPTGLTGGFAGVVGVVVGGV